MAADDTLEVALLVHGDREYLLEPGTEFGTDLGVLEIPEDVRAGQTLETHLGEPFAVREPRGPDLFDHFERTGAPMMPRDIGLVVGHTGACADDRVEVALNWDVKEALKGNPQGRFVITPAIAATVDTSSVGQ